LSESLSEISDNVCCEELTHIPPLNLSDTDTIFPNISTHQHSALNMNKLTKCREFNGYPQDNAKHFFLKRTIIVSHDRLASSLNAENQDNAGPRRIP
jgi:hypothetical protein